MAKSWDVIYIRLETTAGQALRELAAREKRSIANMVEVIIDEWLANKRPIISTGKETTPS